MSKTKAINIAEAISEYDDKFIKRQFNPIDYDDAKAIEKLNKELGTEFHVYMKPKAGYASRQIIDHPNTRFTVKNKDFAYFPCCVKMPCITCKSLVYNK